MLDRAIYEGQFCTFGFTGRDRLLINRFAPRRHRSNPLCFHLNKTVVLLPSSTGSFCGQGERKLSRAGLLWVTQRLTYFRVVPCCGESGRFAAVSLKTWLAVAIPDRHTPSAELEAAHAAHPLQAFLDPLFRPASLPLYSATQPACGAMTGRCHLARRQSD